MTVPVPATAAHFTPDAAVLSAVRICPSSPTARRTEVAPSCPIRSPLVDVGESASKAAVAAVCPVPPLAIATVPVTFAAVPETFPVTLPTTSRVADPPALRLTIVEGVLASVAARARATPEATFAALVPPTLATDGEAAVPERSPASWTIPFAAPLASEIPRVRSPARVPPPVSGADVVRLLVVGTLAASEAVNPVTSASACVWAVGARESERRVSLPLTTSPAAASPVAGTLSTADVPSPSVVRWFAAVVSSRRSRPAAVSVTLSGAPVPAVARPMSVSVGIACIFANVTESGSIAHAVPLPETVRSPLSPSARRVAGSCAVGTLPVPSSEAYPLTAPLFAVFSLAASAATRPVTSACGIASAVFRLAARSDTRSVTCDWAMPPAS